MPKPTTVNDYLNSAPKESQSRLKQLRAAVKTVVPEAKEKISYGIPFYSYHGRLVYFAYAKNHIGIYAIFDPVRIQFAKELEGMVQSKGTIQFSNDKPLPLDLFKRLVKAQAEYNHANDKK